MTAREARRLCGPVFVAVLLAWITGPRTTLAQEAKQSGKEKADPVVTKAYLNTHTLDDDKDHDTGIYVKVHTNDGQTLIAHIDNADNSGDDGTQYKDNSDHQVALIVDADNLTKDAARGARIEVCQHTKGHDTWKFRGTVLLKFSDGTNLTFDSGDRKLVNDGACTNWGG